MLLPRRTRPSTPRTTGSPVRPSPREGIRSRYGGLRVQGTASSPSSTTGRYVTPRGTKSQIPAWQAGISGAEEVGFEPTEDCSSRALQARALGQTTRLLPDNLADYTTNKRFLQAGAALVPFQGENDVSCHCEPPEGRRSNPLACSVEIASSLAALAPRNDMHQNHVEKVPVCQAKFQKHSYFFLRRFERLALLEVLDLPAMAGWAAGAAPLAAISCRM